MGIELVLDRNKKLTKIWNNLDENKTKTGLELDQKKVL